MFYPSLGIYLIYVQDGPILQRTELYLLAPRLELHPILTMSFKGFHLNFNLASGAYSTSVILPPVLAI